jgi:hypothetical protein
VPYPAKPARQYSFTDHSTNQPTTPQPGNNLDGEYDRTNISVGQVIDFVGVSLNTDGTLRTASVGQPQIAPGVFDFIANDAIAQVQPLVDDAQSFANSSLSSSQTAQAAATAADHSATTSSGAASTASTAASNAQVSASAAQASATTATNAATTATNAADDAAGDLATCTDYGVLTQAWAEHMPDTIPPNILAVMDVTGDHWSSRWWANQADITVTDGIQDVIDAGNDAIAAFERYYLGAFPLPPSSDTQGNPVTTGAMYYDLTLGTMYVWNGSQWQPVTKPSPVQTYNFVYVATAGQTVFSGPDRDGNILVYNPAAYQHVATFKRGSLLTPTTDYTAIVNQVTLATGATAGDIVQVWVESVPTVKLDWRTARMDVTGWAFNGSQTSFVLKDAAGATLIAASPSDILLSLDGTWQQAFADYTVSSSTLTFTTAPPADAQVFGIAVVPVPDVATPQPGLTAIDTTSWVFDGVAVNFPILDRQGAAVVPVAAENLLVSLNGIWQAAALDYSVAGSTITFTVPPEPDATSFGVAGLPAFIGA